MGTYNGYDMVGVIGILVPNGYALGDEFFGFPHYSGGIDCIRNGDKQTLIDAYHAGLVRDEDLHTIAQKWYDQLCELYGEDRVREFYGEFAARYE